METRALEIVFLTNYTDFCYRTIPAIAQMADDFAMRLTIVHATMNRTPSVEDRIKLESFFPEADTYPRLRRMALKGDPVDAVKRLSMMHPVDLVIAPASDPLGLPRFWHKSLRARLLREARIPLWTMDRRTPAAKLLKAPRRVGCWIDFHRGWTGHVAFAREYAGAVGAELHVLHALPEICDGTVAGEDQPLSKAGVIDAVTRAIGPAGAPAHFHVAESDGRGTRMKLLENAGVDVVFSGAVDPRLPAWLAPKPRLMNECICPVVHVPVDTPVPVWQMAKARSAPVAEAVYSMAQRG
jgi:hypothetical protein